jgi:hypothetical protein
MPEDRCRARGGVAEAVLLEGMASLVKPVPVEVEVKAGGTSGGQLEVL